MFRLPCYIPNNKTIESQKLYVFPLVIPIVQEKKKKPTGSQTEKINNQEATENSEQNLDPKPDVVGKSLRYLVLVNEVRLSRTKSDYYDFSDSSDSSDGSEKDDPKPKLTDSGLIFRYFESRSRKVLRQTHTVQESSCGDSLGYDFESESFHS